MSPENRLPYPWPRTIANCGQLQRNSMAIGVVGISMNYTRVQYGWHCQSLRIWQLLILDRVLQCQGCYKNLAQAKIVFFGHLDLFDGLRGGLCTGEEESDKGGAEGSIRVERMVRPISIIGRKRSQRPPTDRG